MKKKAINDLIFLIILSCPLKAQECVSDFISELQSQVQVLKKKEKKDVIDFMKVGYKVHPEYKLQDSNVIAKPIYCLLYKKDNYVQKDIKKLLCYIDTKRFYIDEVYFYKDSIFYGYAYSAYSNFPDQPFGKSVFYADLAQTILKENPDMIFTIGQTNSYYLFLKNNQIFVYARASSEDTKYLKYKLEDYMNNHLDEYNLIFGYDYSPPIYCR